MTSKQKKLSRKAVVSVTDDELYDWVAKIYKEDELDPECLKMLTDRSSNVFFQQAFRDVFIEMKQFGKSGAHFLDCVKMDAEGMVVVPLEEAMRDLDYQITVLQNNALTCDFVIIDAMIRLGANTDLILPGNNNETALSMACKMIQMDLPGHIHPGRLRIIHRLLQVGVDPNAGYALHKVCEAGDIQTAALLLQYGADSSIQRPEDGKRPHQLLPPRLRKRFQKLPRSPAPPKLCWCLEGKLAHECHENKDHPKECDPDFGCPCKSGKLYGKCCQRRGVKYTETRDKTTQHRTIPVDSKDDGMVGMVDALKLMSVGKKPTDKVFPGLTTTDFDEHRAKMADRLTTLLPREKFDPAYAHAMKKTDFFPKYAVGILPKNEMILRRDEWNAAVDDYITTRTTTASNDDRRRLEIEQQAKIAWDGSRLYKECAACGVIEDVVGEFMACSRCKMRQYCSKDCQIDHWKNASHKIKCGKETESENETLYFKSHTSVDEVMAQMTKDVMTGNAFSEAIGLG